MSRSCYIRSPPPLPPRTRRALLPAVRAVLSLSVFRAPSAAPCELVYIFGVSSNGDGYLRRRTGCGREPSPSSSPPRRPPVRVCVCLGLGWCCAYLSVCVFALVPIVPGGPCSWARSRILNTEFRVFTSHRSFALCGSTLENGHCSCCAPMISSAFCSCRSSKTKTISLLAWPMVDRSMVDCSMVDLTTCGVHEFPPGSLLDDFP